MPHAGEFMSRLLLVTCLACIIVAACAHAPTAAPPLPEVTLPELALQAEVRRTTYGVPQIMAENLRAAAFALAYVQLEDHGVGIIRGMQAARGRLALVEGAGRIDADAAAQQRHDRARETFDLLLADTRDVYTGFAEGMNHFIRMHRAELPEWVVPDFTPQDVLARDIVWPTASATNALMRRLRDNPGDAPLLVADETGAWHRVGAGDATSATSATTFGLAEADADESDVGSNAWALAPGRTTSGHAMLMRNPHLAWTAGYYEAHLRVPGKLDFYGDFRIGGPFTVIGGFNPHLGFSTTNNATRSHEFYALRLHPTLPDHVVIDGAAVALRSDTIVVEYRDGADVGSATRVLWSTPFGPLVHRDDSLAYTYRAAATGEFRAGEQWLEMMKAESLDEWRDAMRIQARTTSNFTYADAAGNIFYAWVTTAPLLPHPAGGDSLAVLVTRTEQVWSSIAPFDALPQLLNPSGGYVRNENDSPHYTNMNHVLPDTFGFWVESPRLRLRSQHGLELLHNDRVFSLEDAVEAKHSTRMLLADRVKPDLLQAVQAGRPVGEIARAAELLATWDNTVAVDSRGAVLFETWWNRYRTIRAGRPLHATEWSPEEPTTTPRGLADTELAVEAFGWAVPETSRLFGAWDVAWGDVHRVRRGGVDVPVAGCAGALGCFRVLTFSPANDGRRVVDGGDGWVLAVEFGPVPRAYSVLAYGQSNDPASPHHADQAALFAAGRMKPVLWTEASITGATLRRYHPGAERRSAR
jgi:acyl-homoserine-lactone acylase